MWLLGTGLCLARDSTLLYNLTLSWRFSWHFSWHFAWHLLDTFLDALQNRMRMRKYCAGIAGCRFARTVLLISRRACHHTPMPMICDRLWPGKDLSSNRHGHLAHLRFARTSMVVMPMTSKYNRRRALPCSMKPHGQGGPNNVHCHCILFWCFVKGPTLALAHALDATWKALLSHVPMPLLLRYTVFSCTCAYPWCCIDIPSFAPAHALAATLQDRPLTDSNLKRLQTRRCVVVFRAMAMSAMLSFMLLATGASLRSNQHELLDLMPKPEPDYSSINYGNFTGREGRESKKIDFDDIKALIDYLTREDEFRRGLRTTGVDVMRLVSIYQEVPKANDLKPWIDWFHSEDGGGEKYKQDAIKAALEVLFDGNHSSLEDIKKWSDLFYSYFEDKVGSSKKRKLSYRKKATQRALEVLATEDHPDMETLDAWTRALASKDMLFGDKDEASQYALAALTTKRTLAEMAWVFFRVKSWDVMGNLPSQIIPDRPAGPGFWPWPCHFCVAFRIAMS